jgi:hypothetical protein
LLSAVSVSHAQQAQVTTDPLRERAQQSVAGPSILLGTGLALIVAAPAATLALAFSGRSWYEDDNDTSSLNNDGTAIGVGVGMTLIGSALSAWGIANVVQIRSARRRLARMENVSLGLAPGRAQLALSFRY